MTFGIAGSHRTGKTTLARAVAKEMGFHFHETSTATVMRERGFDMVGDMSFARRLQAQEILLDHHLRMIAILPRPLVLDRTPLDMMAYLLAEVGMHTLDDPDLQRRVDAYVEACLHATRLHYDVVLAVRPLDDYAVEDGKPPMNEPYQHHVQFLIEGGLSQVCRYVVTGTLPMQDFDMRVKTTCNLLSSRMETITAMRQETILH